MKPFLWTPGEGVDSFALERLRKHFKQPLEPMGEAWFMGGDRRLFNELLGDPDRLSTTELQDALVEIAGGTSSFGPMPEWHAWYHYLLAMLLPRSHEYFVFYLVENLITSFVALYPNGIGREPYDGFRDDVLVTLGRCMMDAQCWNGSGIVIGEILHRSNDNPNRIWRWWDASGDFSASMFFCLKYLPEALLEPWLRSVLAIPSPHWRAQMMTWCVGAAELLDGRVGWPSQLRGNAYPSIAWNWSHCLKPELATADDSGLPPAATLISAESRLRFVQLLQSRFTEDIYLDWLTSISTVPYLQDELAAIPVTFEQLYVR